MAENSNLIIDYIKTKSGIAQINYESLANLPDLSNIKSNDIYIAKIALTLDAVPEGTTILGQVGKAEMMMGEYIPGETTYADIQAAIQSGKIVQAKVFMKMETADGGIEYADMGFLAPLYELDAESPLEGNFVFRFVTSLLTSSMSLKNEEACYIECTPTQVGALVTTISPQFFLINATAGDTSGTLKLDTESDWGKLGGTNSALSDGLQIISYLWQKDLNRLYQLTQYDSNIVKYQTIPQLNDNGEWAIYTAICDLTAKIISVTENILSSSGSGSSIILDSAPTADSKNGVTSGGVHTAVSAISNRLDKETTPTEGSTNILTSGDIYTVQQNLIEAVNKRSTGRKYDTVAAMNADITNLGASLKLGDVAYISATGVADYWWDGTQYIEIETKTDLSGYLTTADAATTYVAKADLPTQYSFVTSTAAPTAGTASTVVTFVTEA